MEAQEFFIFTFLENCILVKGSLSRTLLQLGTFKTNACTKQDDSFIKLFLNLYSKITYGKTDFIHYSIFNVEAFIGNFL